MILSSRHHILPRSLILTRSPSKFLFSFPVITTSPSLFVRPCSVLFSSSPHGSALQKLTFNQSPSFTQSKNFSQQVRNITVKSPPDARTERFWELWNEEIKAIRQGREFAPKDVLFMRSLLRNRSGLSGLTKTVLFVLFFYLFFQAIKEYQLDRKTIVKKVDKRLEEALLRVLPVVKLTLEHDIPIVLRADSKKYTIVGQHRFFSFLFRYFEKADSDFIFSLYEKCFLVQCEIDLVLVGAKGASTKLPQRRQTKSNKEEKEVDSKKTTEDQPIVKSLKAPIKCYVQVSRVGGITKIDSIKLAFVGEERKLRIPAEPKPYYEWNWHALAFSAKV